MGRTTLSCFCVRMTPMSEAGGAYPRHPDSP